MSEWNRAETIKLSSGRSVTLRRVSLEELVVMGQVPNSLTAVIARILADPEIVGRPATEIFGGDPIEAVRGATELNKAMATLSLVDPKLTDTPDYAAKDPEEASFFDFSPQEQLEISNWINGVVEQLEPFPE
jgi:hypothetical protein